MTSTWNSKRRKVRLNILEPYKAIDTTDKMVIVAMNPRGSGKTVNTAKIIIKWLKEGKRGIVMRDTAVSIKQSILFDVRKYLQEIQSAGLMTDLDVQERGVKKIYENGQTKDLLFQLGFKASNNDIKTKMKSLSDIDFIVVEEAEDVRDKEAVRRLKDTLVRFDQAKIVFLLNAPDRGHFIVEDYFDLLPSEHDGYYIPTPKRKDVEYIIATHKDNTYLNERSHAQYESYGDPNHTDYDLEHYLVDICGLVSEGRKGAIVKNWDIIEDDEFDNLPYPSMFGIDYGFSNDPTAIMEVKVHKRDIYVKELEYSTGLSQDDIYERVKSLGGLLVSEVDPRMVDFLRRKGVWVTQAKKGAGSVEARANEFNKSYFHVCRSSVNTQNECRLYVYSQDKNKKLTNIPVDEHNHAMDAIGYAMERIIRQNM